MANQLDVILFINCCLACASSLPASRQAIAPDSLNLFVDFTLPIYRRYWLTFADDDDPIQDAPDTPVGYLVKLPEPDDISFQLSTPAHSENIRIVSVRLFFRLL